MRFLLVGNRHINVERIDAVLLKDPQSAAVWFCGNREPLQARADEVPAIQQHVREAMGATCPRP